MKRLGRWAFNILAGVSLVLCVAAVAAAMRYRGRFDSAEWSGRTRFVLVMLRPAELHVAGGRYEHGADTDAPSAAWPIGTRFEVGATAPAGSESVFDAYPHAAGFYAGSFIAYGGTPRQPRPLRRSALRRAGGGRRRPSGHVGSVAMAVEAAHQADRGRFVPPLRLRPARHPRPLPRVRARAGRVIETVTLAVVPSCTHPAMSRLGTTSSISPK